ncbi:hypothetical protein E2C01_036728 [Portunus trituberculatus]|uniref:Uncharacterized protein n=1 Tax=Portunus trituberculatus TaxID=210409 RepID=A0A5B7F9G6_PORTR|nr:hypothetical protein [Portunus trituberculatus]
MFLEGLWRRWCCSHGVPRTPVARNTRLSPAVFTLLLPGSFLLRLLHVILADIDYWSRAATRTWAKQGTTFWAFRDLYKQPPEDVTSQVTAAPVPAAPHRRTRAARRPTVLAHRAPPHSHACTVGV